MYSSPANQDEFPREKLLQFGPEHLSDLDLTALLLGSGSRERDVLSISREVLEVFDRVGPGIRLQDLTIIRGIGLAKSSIFVAAIEFARRRIRPFGLKVKGPEDVFRLLRHMADRKQEAFLVVSLNGAHEVIASRVVTLGLLNRTLVHPREVFAEPICDRAAAIVLAHNHPSGELRPSEEDRKVTEELIKAGRILGIPILDHLIFSEKDFCSLKELALCEF